MTPRDQAGLGSVGAVTEPERAEGLEGGHELQVGRGVDRVGAVIGLSLIHISLTGPTDRTH